MRKELEECFDINSLIHKKEKRENRIEQDQEFLKECELRIKQVKALNENQIEFKNVRFRR